MIGRHDPALLAAMTASLRHRGPDGEGTHVDGPLGLGHRRLAVLDPSGSAQPMASVDGRCHVSFNGEIYNFKALRSELLDSGQHLRTRGDTEVLLAGYQYWGLHGLLGRLRGMFAFALWDAGSRTLVIVRDRLGIKPLYYATLPDAALLFASEPKALLACAEIDRSLDLVSLDAYLDLFYVPPPRSIFAGIRQLPPGHLLTWREGQVTVERWWDAPPRAPDPRLRTLADWAEMIEPILREAVELHTVSDVPLGAFLSGGLDSSAIVALMAAHSSHPVQTFCVGYGAEGASYEERPVARRVAQFFGANHRELELDIDLLGDLEPLVRGFDEPFGSWAALLSHRLSAFTRQHVTVALAGDGGDEVFGGYPRYLGLRLSEHLSHAPGPMLELARRVLARAGEPTTARSLRRWARQFLEGCRLPPPDRYATWVGYAPPAARDRLYTAATRARVHAAGRLASPVAAVFAEPVFGDMVQRAGYADLRGFLAENVLRGSDRMSMAHGLEVRVPFCDHVLVEAMAGAPAAMRVTALASKRVLRRIMSGKVPAEVLTRKKLGFTAPFGVWLKRAEAQIAGDLLHPQQIARRGLFEPAEVARLLAEHRLGQRDHSHRIWSLLVLEQWQRMYDD